VRNVIALNHVSFLDAPIILSLLDEPPIFAIDRSIAQRWWVKRSWVWRTRGRSTPARPLATRALIAAIGQGRRLVIFPEGRITVTGSLMKVYDGAAMIADKSGALVTPVRLDGPERTPFSRLDRSQTGRRWFPKITVTILPARVLAVDPALTAARAVAPPARRSNDIMSDLMFETTRYRFTAAPGVFERGARTRGSAAAASSCRTRPVDSVSRVSASPVALLAREFAGMTRPGRNRSA